jgi:hypothetical protein
VFFQLIISIFNDYASCNESMSNDFRIIMSSKLREMDVKSDCDGNILSRVFISVLPF